MHAVCYLGGVEPREPLEARPGSPQVQVPDGVGASSEVPSTSGPVTEALSAPLPRFEAEVKVAGAILRIERVGKHANFVIEYFEGDDCVIYNFESLDTASPKLRALIGILEVFGAE